MSTEAPLKLFTAHGTFQAGPTWRVDVAVPNFPTRDEAEAYAQDFRIKLVERRLLRDDGKKSGLFDETSREVLDSQVTILRRTANSQEAYEPVTLPIEQWQREPGLNGEFDMSAWRVEEDPV